tara:strand:+ start:4290 stop:4511 length:222 start_codon:yes stop_codon:yes gene_type:complete
MFKQDFMSKDNDKDLELTLQKVVSYAVLRIELANEEKTKRCIFQEYKEWLGSSIDDWVLALPHDWNKSDANFY